ncbi:MAG: hypothetical protein HONBIEJF_00681 [Fimbriimonadaceae bacterium]|nr:hypothetical protein [Fimbriimonadaceae bacterium]
MCAATANASLVTNGSFESPGFAGSHLIVLPGDPSITGWTIAGDGRDIVLHHAPDVGNATGNPTFNFAQDGDYYLDLSGTGSPHATIYQDLTTVVNTSYKLSFYIGATNENAPAPTINVQLDGTSSLLNTTLTPSAPGTNIIWTLQTFNFVADSTTTRLSFCGTSALDDNASFVDNVSVEVVPEPASLLAVSAGLAALSRRRRR